MPGILRNHADHNGTVTGQKFASLEGVHHRTHHWSAIALFATSCAINPVGKDVPYCELRALTQFPIEVNRDLDILFVIDNSTSMSDEQASLITNFGRLISVLETLKGGLPNLHVGVVSTDVGAGDSGGNCRGAGDDGALQSAPRSAGCSGPNGTYISDVANTDGTRTSNYSGSLVDTFGCIAALGTDGCGFEQPLESMRRALGNSVPANAGFLREDAFLLVIIISDEDDCSAYDQTIFSTANADAGPLSSFRCFEYGVVCEPNEPREPGTKSNCRARDSSPYLVDVGDYVQFLKSLKSDPNMVAVSVIIGNPDPVVVGANGDGDPVLEASCESAAGAASPGVRLADFAGEFSSRNTVQSICNDDLSGALTSLAQGLARVLSSACLAGTIDLEPDTTGLQLQCVVSDVRFPETAERQETFISECPSAAPGPGDLPCWRITAEPTVCTDTPTGATLKVLRGGANVPAGTYLTARCDQTCESIEP